MLWKKYFSPSDDKIAYQVLEASLIVDPGRLHRVGGDIYYSEAIRTRDFEYQQWKMRYFRIWGAVFSFDTEIKFKIPDDVCEMIQCGTILENSTGHLIPMLDDVGLAVWFMETGLFSSECLSLKLSGRWSPGEQIHARAFFTRFNIREVVELPDGCTFIMGRDDALKFKSVVFPHVIPSQRFRFGALLEGMHDVSKAPSESKLGIHKVGIRCVPVSLHIHLHSGVQETVAEASVYTDLSPEVTGSHLSRLVEVLGSIESQAIKSDMGIMRAYLDKLAERLGSQDAYLKLRFPILLKKPAPVSGILGTMRFDCTLQGELLEGDLRVYKKIRVPYVSACICSKSISLFNAHSQRSFADVTVLLRDEDINYEDIIEIVEASCSAPIRALLKREDEKFVTEMMYDNAGFVETIIRSVALKLDTLPLRGWSVCCEHFESIHQHNAVSIIRGGNEFVY